MTSYESRHIDEDTIVILQDDREKKPYDFSVLDDDICVIEERLETGDYQLLRATKNVAVERKSLTDLAQCIPDGDYGNRDNFEAELERAQDFTHFVVIIEDPKQDLYAYKGQRTCPNYGSRYLHPNAVIGSIEAWEKRYDIPFIWAGNRVNAARLCVHHLTSHT